MNTVPNDYWDIPELDEVEICLTEQMEVDRLLSKDGI